MRFQEVIEERRWQREVRSREVIDDDREVKQRSQSRHHSHPTNTATYNGLINKPYAAIRAATGTAAINDSMVFATR